MAYWQEELTYLKGIGPKRAELLARELGLHTFEDLLYHLPRRYVDKRQLTPIGMLTEGTGAVTLEGKLSAYQVLETSKRRRLLKAILEDSTGQVELVWFRAQKWVVQRYPPGTHVRAYGKPVFFQHHPQIAHPDLETVEAAMPFTGTIDPVYSTTDALTRAGLDSRGLGRAIAQLLSSGQAVLPEFLPHHLLATYRLMHRKDALLALHQPADPETLAAAQHRIKFEELLLFQLILAQHRKRVLQQRASFAFPHIGEYFNRFYQECLPFELTNAQKKVLREVRQDVARSFQMNRLVQGDVGSGKTLVALMSMLMALDNGYQAALMAPTEILAQQHAVKIGRFLAPLQLPIGLLTGSVTGTPRREVLEGLASGTLKLVVGTHALLEEPVKFQRLGLTIVDEQHKFGVRQRARLWAKTAPHYPHNLMLTATPIPRTLALTAYGEVDVSTIDELPPGRQPIETRLYSYRNRLTVNGILKRQLEQGAQVYVVYPLVSESEKSDLLAAESGYEALRRALPGHRLGIVHGQMPAEAKEYEMRAFVEGRTRILVATTVIEVGVDVPSATVMVIENAERFGLSQLHQLRGRVGRGTGKSLCLLVTGERVSQTSKARLKVLAESNNGFVIAQKDLELRGPGDFLGTRQSGLPSFQLADIAQDSELVAITRQAAAALIEKDPALEAPEHASLSAFLERYRRQHNLVLLTA